MPLFRLAKYSLDHRRTSAIQPFKTLRLTVCSQSLQRCVMFPGRVALTFVRVLNNVRSVLETRTNVRATLCDVCRAHAEHDVVETTPRLRRTHKTNTNIIHRGTVRSIAIRRVRTYRIRHKPQTLDRSAYHLHHMVIITPITRHNIQSQHHPRPIIDDSLLLIPRLFPPARKPATAHPDQDYRPSGHDWRASPPGSSSHPHVTPGPRLTHSLCIGQYCVQTTR